MLFNSYEFILLFLPATVAVFLLFGAMSRSLALAWIIVASVAFYAWWRPLNLAIIAPSILVNYGFGLALLGLASDERRHRLRTLVLTLGVAFNLAFLGFFKYANFAVTVANDIGGASFVLEQIILPLGISFITFQKIAFLVDVAGSRIKSFTLRDFLLFVVFFPQLIAGPIVHYREMIPQFQRASGRFDATLYASAITLFCFGLFKKVVLADGIALHVNPVFAFAAAGEQATLVQSWFAAMGFTLQIYFDFSGYSDMACGAALFFGVRLPANFDSPLKANNIIDFWLRWHITLTRFLTAYVYNPLALWLSRGRAARKQSPLRAHNSALSAFLSVLVFPTLMTMLLSGIWHGAGYTFIVWGLLHGLYLIINHAWRQYGPKQKTSPRPIAAALSWLAGSVLTFVAVVIAMVFFRSPDLTAAAAMLEGMLGLNGVGLPRSLAEAVGMPQLGPMVLTSGEVWLRDFVFAAAMLGALLCIAFFAPNSLQMLAKYDPVLQTPSRPPRLMGIGPTVYWRPTLLWFALIASLAASAMIRLTGESEFLYWQF